MKQIPTPPKEKCEIPGVDCGKHRISYYERIYCEVHLPFKAFKHQLGRLQSKKKR